MRGGVLQLSRWGLLDRIVDGGTPPVRTTVYDYGEARRVIAIKPAYGVDALYAPRRTLLDPVLADGAREAGAEVRHGVVVTGLLQERGRVVGVRVRAGSGTRDLRARLVIGADGIRSLVARQAGAEERNRTTSFTAATYGYWRGVPTEGYEWTFRAGASAGAIPTGDGLVCVFASLSPERMGRGGVDVIRDVVGRTTPSLAARLDVGELVGVTRTWPGTPGYLRQAHGPGWALVGDAGYFKDPAVAHGLTDALRDAELLARAVVAGFADDQELAAALDGYEATRDRLSLPLLQVADRVASLDWDDSEIEDLMRQLSSITVAEVELLAGLGEPELAGVVS
jgi:2-polyprenyl-6-methoxyphenol hydroxylase-like FAD-dependent oxidoreductase